MNAYFFKMSQAEKNDILDQHKEIYDGYVTNYAQPNLQPLYIQDYANDKNGITVSNKGVIKNYTNMNINEANAMTGSKYVPDVTFDFGGPDNPLDEKHDLDLPTDKIADEPEHFEHGTFDEEFFEKLDEEEVETLKEQLDRTLDMFKRFKNF